MAVVGIVEARADFPEYISFPHTLEAQFFPLDLKEEEEDSIGRASEEEEEEEEERGDMENTEERAEAEGEEVTVEA